MREKTLKTEALTMCKAMLPIAAFCTVEQNIQTMFDTGDGEGNNKATPEQIISFLKETNLSSLEFKVDEPSPFFEMKNTLTQIIIHASNRDPNRGEFREKLLRNFLDKQKQKHIHSDKSVYDAITDGLRTVEHSTDIPALKVTVVTNGQLMSEEHFNLFARLCLSKIQEKDLKNIDPTKINSSDELKDEIWNDIDMGKIYDITAFLATIIQEIKKLKEKGDELSNRGYTDAARAAIGLHDNLILEIYNVSLGKTLINSLNETCQKLITNAETSELKDHRGFFGTIWHGIKVALNKITFGAVAIKPTDTINKVTQLKTTLNTLCDSASKAKEVDENDNSKHPSM